MSDISIPVLLAWSCADAADLRTANEKCKASLCDAGHCPRTAVLGPSADIASVFDIDGANADLHERLRQLIGQLDAWDCRECNFTDGREVTGDHRFEGYRLAWSDSPVGEPQAQQKIHQI